MRLAIADPDQASADVLAFVAEQRGHRAIAVPHVDRLFEALPFEPSVVVLSMSAVTGPELAPISRLKNVFPELTILVTSEGRDVNASCTALESGAHDFVRSPYNPREVIMRAEVWVATRATPAPEQDVAQVADLHIDLSRYMAIKNNVAMQMTKLELRLLYCLCEHFPHLASTERLLTFGWEHPEEADAALIKTHISHIRKKLQEAGGTELAIRSRQTIGYELAIAGG